MGSGEPELGKKLLKVFLKKLAESDYKIDLIGCVNSGIKLTSKGSEVVDSLKVLESKGAKIATCKTCLDYYGLHDDLVIGGVGNMEDTVNIMLNAEKVIKPC
jgi:selenium metabolism protein YedF